MVRIAAWNAKAVELPSRDQVFGLHRVPITLGSATHKRLIRWAVDGTWAEFGATCSVSNKVGFRP
ncbi:hypothetical protein ACWDE9_36260, partial [Streptomyces olivaceoviridis]